MVEIAELQPYNESRIESKLKLLVFYALDFEFASKFVHILEM